MGQSRYVLAVLAGCLALIVASCAPVPSQTISPSVLPETTNVVAPSVTATPSESSSCGIETSTGEQLYSKPVIYLYPPSKTTVSVRLWVDGVITHTEPSIAPDNSWRVIAHPSGLLTDASGRSYPYLFWEADASASFDMSTGFVVAGADSERFLAAKLTGLGLSASEATAFMDYWLPLMEGNPYNLIHFEGPVYEKSARLFVVPAPDTQLRVFMVFKRLETPRRVRAQVLPTPPARRGFTLVEWGGTEIDAK